jgi:2-polyprenyl-6-methoxyphenol hydroxylase-like FAD-dependent oxidoreductase
MKTRKIAVIGAGIGGLATGVLLHRAGHDVTIFERFAAARPVGSGLVIQPVGLAVLDAMGVDARAYGAPVTRMVGHDRGRRVLAVAYPRQAPGWGMHRASLFHVLWSAIQAAGMPVVTDAQVVAVPMDGGQRRVTLASGDAGAFDLVVDASGAGSALSPLVARPLPYGAIWGHVPWPDETTLDKASLQQAYHAAARMAGILPIGPLPGDARPRAAVFWSMPVEHLPRWHLRNLAEWKAEVMALWPQMAPFLAAITEAAQMTTARYAHGTLARPYGQGLVHIGDAAHRASPQLGQGANMALLDAYALSVALRGPWPDALPAYARMRRWHVRAYQAMSAVFTPMYQSESRVLPVLRNHVLAPMAELPLVRSLLTRLVSGDVIPPLAGVRFPEVRTIGRV